MHNIIINNASSPDLLLAKFPYAKVIEWQDPHTVEVSSETMYTWILDTRVDYTDFDLYYSPLPWESEQSHCFNDNTLLKPSKHNGQTNFHTVQNLKTYITAKIFTVDNPTSEELWRIVEEADSFHVWIINSNIDYSEFNFGYVPTPAENKNLHVWRSTQADFGETLLIPRISPVPLIRTTIFSFFQLQFHPEELHKISGHVTHFPVYIKDHHSTPNTLLLQWFPDATILDSDTDIHSIQEQAWVLSSYIDYSTFDFSYIPSVYESSYTHCWLTANNDFGDTYLVSGIANSSIRYHDALNYIPSVSSNSNSFYDIYIMNMGNNDTNIAAIKSLYSSAIVVRYTDHVSTIDRIVNKATSEYVWILSSNIDYTNFNINYRPGGFESLHLHCWKTTGYSFGDTYLVNVNAWRSKHITEITDYSPINYKNNTLPLAIVDDINYKEYDIVILDMGNAANLSYLRGRFPFAIVVRFTDLFNSIKRAAMKVSTKHFWVLSSDIDYSSFNFLWRVDPSEAKQLHCWSTIGEEFGSTFFINTAMFNECADSITRIVDYKPAVNYTHEALTKLVTADNVMPSVFIHNIGGNDLNVASLQRLIPTAVVIPYMHNDFSALKFAAGNSTTQFFWLINSSIDYSNFDFSYIHNPYEEEYVHCFTIGNFDMGTFYCNKDLITNTDITSFIDCDLRFRTSADTIHKLPATEEQFTRYDVVIHDKGRNNKNVNALLKKFSSAVVITDIEQLSDISINTPYYWLLNSTIDYNNFDFRFGPSHYEDKQIHAWANDSLFGETFLIPAGITDYTAADDKHDINRRMSDPSLSVLPAEVDNVSSYDMYMMNLGGHDITSIVRQFPLMHVTRWNSDHFNTIKRILKDVKTKYVWVLSSCIDYTDFDFTYQPEPYEAEQLHVWPSEDQKFGDTFLVPSALWQQRVQEITKLEDFGSVNYKHTPLKRKPWQVAEYDDNNVILTINNTTALTPYVIVKHVSESLPVFNQPWLWYNRPVVALTPSHATSLIPRDVFGTKIKQVYDYAYLEKDYVSESKPLDIIFISNGESNAEENYTHLLSVAPHAKRVDGINSRVGAYQAAAELSDTPWFFAVFAKLTVNPLFDWSWQPDYWQEPKHYIFHAKNPVNGLEYGHMSMIAYNKELTLANTGKGLDFTLDQEHAVVPLLSGVANYANDPWMTWRTAFREVLKLKQDYSLTNSIETKYRLKCWLEKGEGEHGQMSINGAKDAVTYYDQCNGDFDKLKLSYEWSWLKEFYTAKNYV